MWLDNPVTLALIDKLNEHISANQEAISGTILGYDAACLVRPDDGYMGTLIQLKGQVHAMEQVLDLESFLEVQEEDKEEIEDEEEIYSSRG